MNIVSLFQQGGPVMWVLLAMSVLAVTIILLKLFQYFRSGLRRLDFVDPALTALQQGDYNSALHALQLQHSPVACVMESAIRCGEIGRASCRERV